MRETIVTGALLHDIGKIIYHALSPQQRYGERHQELGHAWARQAGLPVPVQEVILRHHAISPDDPKYARMAIEAYQGPQEIRNVLYLVAEADNVASGMERTTNRAEGSYDEERGMGVVFDRLSWGDPRDQCTVWEPRLQEQRPYPVPAGRMRGTEVTAFYQKAWAELRDGLANRDNLQEERLLLFLEKCLSTVPEHTFGTGREWPDTSLYHHLRSTAAIAWAGYLHLDAQGVPWQDRDCRHFIADRDAPRYLLIGADLSGIQNFIYTITSRAALKMVRARSFYLELLVESAAVQLYRALGLGRFSLIYASGGGFYLLGANTNRAQAALERFQEDFNNWLYRNFGTDIFLALDALPVSANDLRGDTGRLGGIWTELRSLLQRGKRQKWLRQIEQDPEGFLGPVDVDRECAACHGTLDVAQVNLGDGELELCRFCRLMLLLGQELPNTRRFYEVTPSQHPAGVQVPVAGCTYQFGGERPSQVILEYQVENPWELPSNPDPVVAFPVGTYYHQPDLNRLVQESLGDRQLGVLRMDVDQLGRLFAHGLPRRSFARLSDLASRLNVYFKYYLPHLLASPAGGLLPLTRELLPVNIIYAGGDDLFLVGTWDGALDAAWLIYNDFRRFTGFNPALTISGGLVFADEKIAFYKLAELALGAEELAKESGRDRLTIWGSALRWPEVAGEDGEGRACTVQDILRIFERALERQGRTFRPKGFSRGFLNRLTALAVQFTRLDRERPDERAWVFPQLSYLFARTRTGEGRDKTFQRELLAVALNEEVLRRTMLPALGILKLLLRGVRDDAAGAGSDT